MNQCNSAQAQLPQREQSQRKLTRACAPAGGRKKVQSFDDESKPRAEGWSIGLKDYA